MTILQAVILGLVQGLTEFLPVSSSGHLVLLNNIFGIREGQAFFAVMVHLGTLIAVIIVLRKEIAEILRRPFGRMTWLLIVSTIPIVVFALFFDDFIQAAFGGKFLGFAFIATGIVLTLSETMSKTSVNAKKENVTYPSAFFMGIMQGIAILPGVSRSGMTIAGGLFSGLTRKTCAKFAFLMSIPAILGSAVLEGMNAFKTGFANVEWFPTAIGMVCALISGFIAVRLMLNLIAKKKLYGFAIYVLILGVLVLLDQFVFHMFFPPII